MSHNEVYKQFNTMLHNMLSLPLDVWFPNGKNSIRIRLVDKREFIFTFNGPKDWRFETIDSFLNK